MILERFLVTDKVAVITGAGRGIGAATAIALAEAGADVVIASRTVEDLKEVASRVESAGRKAHVVVTDLRDPAAAVALAEEAVNTFGRLDIVVNNVGGALPRHILSTTVEHLEEAFSFNVSVAHALTAAAIPAMLGGGGGSVVNISAVLGRAPGRGFLAYGAASGACLQYTRLAAADLAPRIRVNAVAVGSVATSGLREILANDAVREPMEQATPLRKLGEAEDVAAAVLYLSSAAGSYLTGKVLQVDGGIEGPNLDLGIPDL
ncbi:SDR family oxidoreductase [Amycolatopsis sp. NPDC059657]|uniref:SDR family oxidoreductase n=1 Tax=Amycolatopsis sp. NPDC059657 TaxID=3346899 RepID=UPI00366C4219